MLTLVAWIADFYYRALELLLSFLELVYEKGYSDINYKSSANYQLWNQI